MSEEDLSNTDEGPSASKLDASMTVDSSTLSSEEADFARQMGFGGDDEDDEPEASAAPAPTDDDAEASTSEKHNDDAQLTTDTQPETEAESPISAEAAKTEHDDAPPEPEISNEEVAAAEATEAQDSDVAEPPEPNEPEEPEAVEAAAVSAAPTPEVQPETPAADQSEAPSAPAKAAPEDDTPAGDFEEIHPRASADGMQEKLEARADEVLEREPAGAVVDTTALDQEIARLQGQIDEAQEAEADFQAQLANRDTELKTLRTAAEHTASLNAETKTLEEKENEELRTEMVSIGIDRDHLIDQLAVTSGKLVQSEGRTEKLEASLRAARGALTPLPEGERALRAEVIGLRGRIEEAAEEYQSLSVDLSENSTELAIVRARVEDRQHEVNCHVERIEDLDEQLARNEDQLSTTVSRHREILAMSTRLQSDNNELRSAQAALQETLQARDLEILAREEHLNVTREGLSARDTQLVDVNERLDQTQHRCEGQDADLQRAEIERDQLLEKIAHRESRIATLTETLARIEQAMGHPIPRPDSPAREMPQAEWSRPVLAQHAIRAKATAAPNTDSDASASDGPASEDGPEASEAADEPHAASDSPETQPTLNIRNEVVAEPKLADPEPIPIVAERSTASEMFAQDASDTAGEAASDAMGVTPAVQTRLANVSVIENQNTPVHADESESALSQLEPVDDETETCCSAPILGAPPPLPSILSAWRDRRFGEIMEGAFTGSVHAFLAERLQRHLGEPGPQYVFLKSLGGSLVDAEVQLVQSLQQLGVEGIRMEVLDIDPAQADARRQRIELAGLGEVIDICVGDLEDWDADAPCHAILLSDALDAQPNAGAFLDHIYGSLTNGAVVLFVDRIASGPIQLSASALIRLEELWEVLPESLATREGLSIVPHRGDDGGFGPSAGTAAAQLLSRFDPIVMAGFGHLADLIVGPTRGGTLSVEDDEAIGLLESIMAIDESRTLIEQLVPRHGIAVFARGNAGSTETLGKTWPSFESKD